jgi:hypothetical protein
MKIKIDLEIDCTPEELKELWNAPNLKPLQDAFIGAVEGQMREQLTTWSPAAWMKLWGLDSALQAPTKRRDREQ